MIKDNLPQWVEVEEALQDVEAPDGAETQEDAESTM